MSLPRKITLTLFAAQGLGSAGIIAAATINSIAGAELSRNPALAGLPSAVYLLASAFAAPGWGAAMDRIGRRGGLALGMLVGALGAGLAGLAVIVRSFPLFLLALALVGVAQAALNLGRFAAAEVHPPAARGRAISNVVLGGTFGAVFGPWMVAPLGVWALSLGYPELAGPYAAALALYLLAGALIFGLLRPDPRDLGRQINPQPTATLDSQAETRPMSVIFRQPGVIVAVSAMAIGQMVMVMLMVITSLHMKGHHHALNDISLVISSHTFGMFAFSVLSGRLADRWGRRAVIAIGAATLLLSCLAATLSPEVLPLALALFLLGLGWNFCYVGGSSLLADHLLPAERARTQGFNDLLVGLASAVGSLGSGVVFAALGYAVMGLAGAALSLLPLGLALAQPKKRFETEAV